MDRAQVIEVIAREMCEALNPADWETLYPDEQDSWLMDAGFMVDGIARVTEEWLLAAGEVGLARKWRVAMGRSEDGEK